jgi:4-amino-4-deoxy-L-arabinose transferase-like glycosyltransferase
VKKYLPFLIFAVIAFLLFYKLGDTFLTNWDEAWYADVARNMARTGNLITPVWNHQPFFDKPPLYYWLSALSFKVFGVSEFAARFFSALAALGVCVLTYFLGRELISKRAGLISAVVVGSSIGFLYRARTGNLDTLLTLWLLLSIYLFYKGLENAKYFLWMGFFLGLGFLTKGVVVFIFPVLGILWLWQRSWTSQDDKRRMSFWGTCDSRIYWGVLIGIFISAAWFLASYFTNGQDFLSGFSHNQFGKVANSTDLLKSFSLDYIGYLKSGLKVWFLFFVPAFVYALIKWRDRKVLLLSFFVIYFGILSISENKSNWFLVPLFPIVALMIGQLMEFFRWKWVIGLVVVVALFQVYHFRAEFIVPETERDEVRVAEAAKNLTNPETPIYLTGLSYPTTIFYSERKSFATYGGGYSKGAWWVLPESSWSEILKTPVYIITTNQEFNDNKYFKDYNFQTLYQSGDRKLIKRL